MESRWLEHVFFPFKGFIFEEKYGEEGRQDTIINGMNQANQKTQRGRREHVNYKDEKYISNPNPLEVPQNTLLQVKNAGGTSLCLRFAR